MAISEGDTNRRLLPAWRSLTDHSSIRETGSLDAPRNFVFDERFLREKLSEWEGIKKSSHSTDAQKNAIGIAVDIVSTALAINKIETGIEAADFLLKNDTTATSHAKSIALQLKKGFESVDETTATSSISQLHNLHKDAKQRVKWLRGQLHESPRNAFLWTDLSLAYITLGLKEQAKKAMQNALFLFPEHRAILRVASRMFVHIGEIDRAHAILKNSENISYDPWLIAAEISTSQVAGRKSKLLTKGQALIKSERYAPRHLSELAGALATQNFYAGNLKHARQLFRESLEDPTDNAIAQVGWAARRDSAIIIPDNILEKRNPAEGKTWHAMIEGKWQDAINHSMDWAFLEPFSSRPVIQASFLLVTLLGEYDKGEEILRFGLQANPVDQTLINNLAVVLAYKGKLREAHEVFEKIKPPYIDGYLEAVWLATAGMLLYRSGELQNGRRLYEQAINKARGDVKSIALLHMAREEIHARSDQAPVVFDRAKNAIGQSKEKILDTLKKKIEQEAKWEQVTSLGRFKFK